MTRTTRVTRTRRALRAMAAVVVGAIGPAVAAGAGFGAGGVSAQSETTLCEPGANGVTPAGSVNAPAQDARFAVPNLKVEGEFHYERDVLGRPNGDFVIHVVLVACQGQVLPEPSEWTKKETGTSNQFAWQTPDLPWNGTYAARVEVTSPAGNRQVVRTFAVVVPPAAPADVRAAQSGDGVNVSWAKSNEPDLVGYVVQRAAPSGAFERIAQVPAAKGVARPSVVDHPPAGDWRYNVVALRKGATDSEGLASDPSAPANASFTPPTPTTTDGGDGGVGQGQAGTTATTAPADPAASAAIAKAGKVDLSKFSTLLDQRARAARAALEEPDPGFQETLPFQPGDEPALADGDQEAGAGETQGEGQQLVSDDSDRRRAVASLASALLLFVMFMGVRWVRTELDEADLEATTPGDEEPAAGDESPPDLDGVASEAASDAASEAATDAGSDAPELDVVGAPFRTRRRRELGQGATESARRSASATGATRRLPPRPADDRGQGPAPVRPRRRGAGGRDGRVPVG